MCSSKRTCAAAKSNIHVCAIETWFAAPNTAQSFRRMAKGSKLCSYQQFRRKFAAELRVYTCRDHFEKKRVGSPFPLLKCFRSLNCTRLQDLNIAQIPLGSSRYVSTRLDTFDVSSESRRACRACQVVLFLHGGRLTNYSARLYKFSRFMLLHTQFIPSNKIS